VFVPAHPHADGDRNSGIDDVRMAPGTGICARKPGFHGDFMPDAPLLGASTALSLSESPEAPIPEFRNAGEAARALKRVFL